MITIAVLFLLLSNVAFAADEGDTLVPSIPHEQQITNLGYSGPLYYTVKREKSPKVDPKSCVFRIRNERHDSKWTYYGNGTAFAVDLSAFKLPGKNYLLTAAHVILDDDKKPHKILTVETKSTENASVWVRCELVAMDLNLDVCILKCAEDLPDMLPLAAGDIEVEAKVTMHGSKRGEVIKAKDGKVKDKFHRGSAWTLASVDFDHGCSGAPVIDEANQIVGIAVSSPLNQKTMDLQTDRCLFVPISCLRSFLVTVAKELK